MVSLERYILGLIDQVLDSYQILVKLKDKPGDLDIIKKELSKINGIINIIINKTESSKTLSKQFQECNSRARYYLKNYYFEREIEIMSPLYGDDPNRIHNIRQKIIESLSDKKLIENLQSMKNEI